MKNLLSRITDAGLMMRDAFRPASFDDLSRDVRYGLRALRLAPAFTVVSSLTLALSIGAATTVFSVVNGVLIKPLPYPDADRLISIWNSSEAPGNRGEVPLSATQFFTYRDENRLFAGFGLWASSTATVTGRNEPAEVRALRVTFGTLQALGVAPAIGRWFSEDDDTPGSAESVILANAYWRRHYGADLSIIGRTVIVDSRPRTVVGVMPAGFRFMNQLPDLILPFRLDRSALLLGSFNYSAVARLNPGVTVERAAADVARMNRIWLNAWPAPPGFQGRTDGIQTDRAGAPRPRRGVEADGGLPARGRQCERAISVAAVTSQVETQSGDVSRVITGEQVNNIALNGRNYAQLVQLLPGAVLTSTDAFSIGLSTTAQSINGVRTPSAYFMVDGADNMDNGANGNTVTSPSLDSIAEVKVLTASYSAEFGGRAGALVNVVTKSGTREFHGSAYEFFRNQRFDARSFFDCDNPAPLEFNNPGFTIGGPVSFWGFNPDRSKLFFFYSQDWKFTD